ncbi:GNAT family N-acetyltransferase [Cellulomonas cellasea]|uniref:GNAT family N-acetyltransferase n=1 Tax=Cellulomonas cellasea TaxID=43670 RepID=UPI0025A360D6|nr:GNAT family N-acetyltransferase [Cellulomonas cellasea]MDM8086005.1 GNAT family N-acetyltransferase [Cellulomonas cellasea]
MTAIIRPADDADLQGLLGLYGELNPDDSALPDARAQEVWAAVRSQRGRTILVAVVGDALAGSIDCVVLPNLTRGGRSIMFVENVIVARQHRRRGIGRLLMDAALSLAESTRCYKIQLLAADSEEAHDFYAASEYRPLAQGFRRYLDEPARIGHHRP